MLEQFFQCPYCWESISMLIESTDGHQEYIEDCEVCCNPIQVKCKVLNGEILEFQAAEIGQ